jgi:hypothetical protein
VIQVDGCSEGLVAFLHKNISPLNLRGRGRLPLRCNRLSVAYLEEEDYNEIQSRNYTSHCESLIAVVLYGKVHYSVGKL